jgi:hypothetical protein
MSQVNLTVTNSPEPRGGRAFSYAGSFMRVARIVLIAATATALTACTEARRESAGTTFSDKPADITCWSYGQAIFQGRSTGKVNTRSEGRIGFVDAANGRYTTVDGDCLIVYEK